MGGRRWRTVGIAGDAIGHMTGSSSPLSPNSNGDSRSDLHDSGQHYRWKLLFQQIYSPK